MRNQEQLEAAKAYLRKHPRQTVRRACSRSTASGGCGRPTRAREQILGVDLEPLIGVRLDDWRGAREPPGRDQRPGRPGDRKPAATRAGRSRSSSPDGRKVLLMRGSALAGSEAGFVVVFDDITRLLQAQRFAAWGEVARRLAHEIKNPLTPIQLSAERLAHRLADKLAGQRCRDAGALHPDHRQAGGAAQGHGGCIQPVRARARRPACSRST